jgi:hypothetical protein
LVLQLNTTVRVRIAASVVALTILWPFCHFVLAARYDVDPWKLAGMAMYCTVHDLTLRFEYRSGDETLRPLQLASLGPELLASVERHSRRRATLGRFHPLDGLAREILEARPDIDELILKTDVKRLDPMTGRIQVVQHDAFRMRASGRSLRNLLDE